MVQKVPNLVLVILALLAVALGPVPPLHAADPIDLAWEDLIPEPPAGGQESQLTVGIAMHGSVTLAPGEGETLDRLVRDHDGKRVRLAGYVVPLEFDGTRVTDFFLVPYVGACVHVPPPPPNQLVYVRAEPGFESDGLFQAVEVTGTISAAPSQDILERSGHGYRIDAETISPAD